MTNYYDRKEILAKTFSPREYQQHVGQWLANRPAILAGEGKIAKISKHAIAEVEEIKEEVEKGDAVTQKMETLDYGWLVVGNLWANGIEVNNDDVRTYVNGVGKRSDIYDRLQEAAGNLGEKTLYKDGHHALGLWFSALAGQDVTNIGNDMQRVIDKNERNYSSLLFGGRDPHTGQPWQGEMMTLAFDIPRMLTRTLRDHLVKVEGLVDRKNGLYASDWVPYYSLLTSFAQARSPEEALQLGELAKLQLHASLLRRGAVDLSSRRGMIYQAA